MLALPGDEQHGSGYLCCRAGSPAAFPALGAFRAAGPRMGVEPHPDLVRGGAQPRADRAVDHCPRADARRSAACRLGKTSGRSRSGSGVPSIGAPHVRVRRKRKHGRHARTAVVLWRQPGAVPRVQVFRCIGAEPTIPLTARRYLWLDVSQAFSLVGARGENAREQAT